ncbi:unnamed protein product [Symbiodinium natans]|uniref:Uncharacterized protein n=1 Tax=Symbiodinium natans TaxID=878477 RepID=A0A812VCI8_9DINO|nr:unnamed protein product [Symbiodinium natans]
MPVVEGLNDYQLFRACGPLYPAFAIESLTSIILGFFFTYLALRIVVRTDVKKPINASWRMFRDYITPVADQWWTLMKTWPDMPNKPCADRITYCRNLNIAMCLAQAFAAFFSVFRWLHIGNVNGLRYLGYAFTCSLMQAELVVLIAPYVPCYKFNIVSVVLFTHAFLICGWIGSLHRGFLFEDASWELFQLSWEVSDLVITSKGVAIGITTCCLAFLCLVQMPFLCFCYFWAGGCRAHNDLPYYYLRLMFAVWFTWPAFPAWWAVSAEGLGVLGDAKSNAVGFAILNMISKGGFTINMLKIGADHRRRWPELVPTANGTQNWLVGKLQEYESDRKEKKLVGTEGPEKDAELKEKKLVGTEGPEKDAELKAAGKGIDTLWV